MLRSRHLPALDGLRAVAVGGVILFHWGLLPFAIGSLGVSLFFVISGFLITHLLLAEHEGAGSVSLGRFYARRALRIFPAYYVFLAVAFALMTMRGTPPSVRLVWSSLLYVTDYVQAFGFDRRTLASHAWSLAIEEQFYLLWPVALLALLGRRANVLLWLGVAVAVVTAWRTTLYLSGHGPHIYYAFDTRADQLMLGCALAVVARRPWWDRVAQALSCRPVFPLLSAIGAYLTFQLPFVGSVATVGYALSGLFFAALIVQAIMLSGHRAWRWLDAAPVRYVGRLSYPLYLYHQLALPMMGAQAGEMRWSKQFLLRGIITLALAMASYHLVETPFLALKGRFARQKGGTAVGTSTSISDTA